MKQVIKRRVVFAEIHQDTRGAEIHRFSIKYRKIDGSIGIKDNVCKSRKALAGTGKFRGNLNQNHELLLVNNETEGVFRIKVDLMVEYNGMVIDHTV